MRGGEARHATATPPVNKETRPMNLPSHRPHRRLAAPTILIASIALLIAAFAAAPAQAAFGLNHFDSRFTNEDGTPATQAGSHPFAFTSSFSLNASEEGPSEFSLDGELRDLFIEQVPGLVGDATAMPRCSNEDWAKPAFGVAQCPPDTQVGVAVANILGPDLFWTGGPVFNLTPPLGTLVKLGFVAVGAPVTIQIKLKPDGEYNVVGGLVKPFQILKPYGGVVQLWGVPSDPRHDGLREFCGAYIFESGGGGEWGFPSHGSCPVPGAMEENPFLTLPRSCEGPQATNYKADSWEEPGAWVEGGVLNHDTATPPNPQGFTGCGKLGFSPAVESRATTESAETGSGLDFNLDFNDEGLKNPNGLAGSDTKKAEVILPEGVTINPSVGEGLGVCTPAQLEGETVSSDPGEGCPNESKVGSLHVDTPLVEEGIDGSIFLAQQDDPATTTPGAENPFDSLIALYFVLQNQTLGVSVKLPVLVEPDPKTGRLVVTLDDVPQLPFNHFNAHMREGQRAALVTPATCGTYTTEAVLTPRANPSEPQTVSSSFEITKGLGGGACPPGGIPPFHPAFEAGSINNNAGSFSPFNMRLIRSDGEQDMTKFSSILPPGELGSLAGVSKCPDSAIGIARAKTGREEIASPSCPANSLIGHTLAGAGVGSALTYVKGQVYLGGPYNGDPLSVISVTPALAGPFDAGTVVVRLALDLNPKTAEVEVDGANSDPIPHILKGIVLKVRDLRVYVDRPNFTLNPTSCDESSARATLFGSYLDVFNPADDVPVALSSRYQAANCLNLGFKPKLALNLKGGTRRGGHPGLVANYQPRRGDANVEGLVVRLPRSAFLDQAHIKTICTRVQFAADACPKNAQYGYIKAWTPLLDEPLQGPVWLRSSNHKLPDLIFDLHGLVDVEVATRIDSAHGGIRATVEDSPDAPLSKVLLRMQGGKKGLIVNSRNLCGHKSKANVLFSGHNGKQFNSDPVMRAECGGKRKAK
jgi:hypothetical protein